jgi:hypothetical protein
LRIARLVDVARLRGDVVAIWSSYSVGAQTMGALKTLTLA